MSGTTDRARQIAALTDKLKPLGGKSRGMPIEAADWNTVVAVLSDVLGIELAQETDSSALADSRYAPIQHQHLGQVTAAWLDTDLQQRTADGGGGVATRQVLADMQRQVTSLLTQVAQLTTLVQAQQASTDRTASNDIDRTRQLIAVDTRIAGLEGLNTTVAGIAHAQQALETNVNTVLDLRKALSDANGKPIDVAGLAKDVADLQGLRDSLTGADGKPLRLRDLQLQIIDLTNRLPQTAGNALEQRLATLGSDLQAHAAADAKTQIDGLRTEMTAANITLASGLTTKLEGEIATARDSVTASATGQIAAAEARLNTNLTNGITAAQAGLTTTLQANVNDAVTKGLANLNSQIATVVDSRVPGLRAQLQTDVQNAVTPVLQKSVADGLAAFGTRLTTVETGLSRLNGGLAAQIQAAVDTSVTTLQTNLAQQVTTQVKAAQDSLSATIDQKVSAGVTAGLANLPTLVTQTVNGSLSNLDARVSAAVTTATSGLAAQVSAAVDAKLAQVNIAGQIKAATDALTTQLHNDIATSAAKVQSDSTAALNASITSLRTEVTNMINTRIPVTRTTPATPGAAVVTRVS